MFERGGFYDRGKELNWKELKDLGECQYTAFIVNLVPYIYFIIAGFFAAMGVAGGGRNEVDPRFISMFTVFSLIFPSDETLYHIYSSILFGHTEPFEEEVKELVPDIIKLTLDLYKVICFTSKFIFNIIVVKRLLF